EQAGDGVDRAHADRFAVKLLERRRHFLAPAPEQRDQQLGLFGEIAIEGRRRDAGLGRDLLHLRLFVALALEQGDGGLNDTVAASLLVAFAPARLGNLARNRRRTVVGRQRQYPSGARAP